MSFAAGQLAEASRLGAATLLEAAGRTGALPSAIKPVAPDMPAGILTGDPAFARRCIDLGAVFTAVGVDVGLLARAADALAQQFRA